jgi:1-acyl-sn-glycerol-3-phosphate acyltransferase
MKFSKFIYFKIMGWTFNRNNVDLRDSGVIIFAPHTSNWDFIIGRMVLRFLGTKPKLLVKSSLFFPPLGWILKAVGGIPVNRTTKNNLTDYISSLFKDNNSLHIIFTPEGTRSKNNNWKKGFYYTAMKAQVPIYIAYADYEKKTGGIIEKFHPTGNYQEDLLYIKSKYYNVKGKHPDHGVSEI